MGKKFFISYTHVEPDNALALFLAEGLKRAQHEVFIDTMIGVGKDWSNEITSRIEWCDYLVVLLSKNVLNSEMVHAEVRLAFQRLKRTNAAPIILPIRVRNEDELGYALGAYLNPLQQVSWNTQADSEMILRKLLEAAVTEGPEAGPEDPLNNIGAGGAAREREDFSRPRPAVDPRAFSAPGGSIKLQDPFYVKRNADMLVAQRAKIRGETLVINAPRQLGKSSLLLRYMSGCEELGKKLALLDFSLFADVDIEDYSNLLTGIAAFLARTFKLDDREPQIKKQSQLTNFVEDAILESFAGPIVLAFDQVDKVFGAPYQKDFFRLLRLWHNKRANVNSLWERVDLALVISMEPHMLADSIEASPFNVTPPVKLTPFESGDSRKLNELYGYPLAESELRSLHALLGGHPYLIRLAFYHLVSPGAPHVSTLIEHAVESDSPFSDHLRAWLLKLCDHPRLVDGMKQILRSGTAEENTFYRLHSCGLVNREGGRIKPSNTLYERFFNKVL
jgi:AAA-like domain/TIR domain